MVYFLTAACQHLRPLFLIRQSGIGSLQSERFADGEYAFRLTEDVKRTAVTIVGSVLPDPASLFELLATFRALRDNRSLTPTLIIPYLAYAWQDRAGRPGEAALGAMVGELIRNANPSAIFVVDPHGPGSLAALGPDARALSAAPLFAEAFRNAEDPIGVVVASTADGEARAAELAGHLGADVAAIDGSNAKARLRESVQGRHVLIFDNVIGTGETITESVRLISRLGALSIRLAATHGLFVHDARERLAALPVRDLVVTNTLPQPRHPRIRVLDVTPLLLSAH